MKSEGEEEGGKERDGRGGRNEYDVGEENEE